VKPANGRSFALFIHPKVVDPASAPLAYLRYTQLLYSRLLGFCQYEGKRQHFLLILQRSMQRFNLTYSERLIFSS
jgi:hypothetical protein